MRATKKQNEIIKAHFDAFENDTFTTSNVTLPIPFNPFFEEGNTSRLLWEAIVENYVSPTSQMMMSTGTFRHISGKAKADIRRGFIKFLNHHNIK